MGINSSTRRVTVVNDNQSGVIRISESVVQKISQNQQTKQQPTQESHTSGDESSLAPTQTIQTPQQHQQQQQQQSHQISNEVVYGIPYSGTAHHEYQQEIQKLEKSWRSQIDELQKQNRNLWRTANDRLVANISQVEKQLPKIRCEPICRDSEKSVVDCYQTNKSQPLKCSKEVRSFVDCVHEVRRVVLNSKGVNQ